MGMRDVPRGEWQAFFDAFTRQYRDEPVTVVKSDTRDGLRVAERAVPLMEMTHDPHSHRITIRVGDPPYGEVSHVVVEPERITVVEPTEADEDPLVSVQLMSGSQQLVVRVERIPVHA
jgi:hypothetical protein